MPERPTFLRTAVAWLTSLAVGGTALITLAAQVPTEPVPLTISIVGTTDVHGYVLENRGRGGLPVLGGYLRNLRAARAADGGAVILLDAGDTYQGGVESDMSEGALVIDAYNALGYTAAAIGNHDFEFGSLDRPGRLVNPTDDARGALKALAARARFPMLAANLLDEATGKPVTWPNVSPSVLVDVAGLKVGILGVMTIDGLRATLVANVRGLRLAPLASTVKEEATALRARGADLVIVTAHAGGRCTQFQDPADLSSCDESEIFDVARGLPAGLIDVIVAGHTHAGLAHEVNGVPIIQANALGQSFGRVDVKVDRRTRRRVEAHLYAPRELCTAVYPGREACPPTDDADVRATRVPAMYEGRVVASDPAIAAAMAPELARVRERRAIELGIVLETPVPRLRGPETPLGNLFAEALLDSSPGADVAINNSGRGGLRADLPAGPLTLGPVYDAFPFDNRLVRFTMSGAELREVFENEVRQRRRGAIGMAGVRVQVTCGGTEIAVDMFRSSGELIRDTDHLQVVTTDQLASGGLFGIFRTSQVRTLDVAPTLPLLREVVASWLQRRGGVLRGEQFVGPDRPRWEFAGAGSDGCGINPSPDPVSTRQ